MWDVPCDGGCTLTQGYWKTHSVNGPAPYDDTWAQIGEGTTFFQSGKSYYDVLWTPPAGNPYYILAHQYIAAELNQLNGASIPADVLDAFEDATAWFENHIRPRPKQIRRYYLGGPRPSPQYNEGAVGPGHCDEDASISAGDREGRHAGQREPG